MANSAQARKRARQAESRRMLNASQRSMYRTYLKKVDAAIDAGDKQAASEALAIAMPIVDKMVSKGIIHRNKAARHKSRLNAKVKAL
ncbi:MAG: 30S ribosomal protein S20 [Gammaproteobacteria bacterium]|nr:30S ribosomal protein S20 [Gammaproteobacteria bacterium]